MNERRKLAEGERFLDHLRNTKFDGSGGFDRAALEDYLSAFVSAARSVLQYALKEASTHAGGQQWYQDALQKYAVGHCWSQTVRFWAGNCQRRFEWLGLFRGFAAKLVQHRREFLLYLRPMRLNVVVEALAPDLAH